MKIFEKSVKFDDNYAGRVVEITNISPIEGADNIVTTVILGKTIIIGKNIPMNTVGLFFDTETKLSDWFLSALNLYRHSEKNANKEKVGFFEDTGRVRALLLRKVKSEGFFIDLKSVQEGFPHLFIMSDFTMSMIGEDFDTFYDQLVAKKYVVRKTEGNGDKKDKQTRKEGIKNLIINFPEHVDTSQLSKNLHKLADNDYIHILVKKHGTSVRFGNILVHRQLNWFENLLTKLGISIKDTEHKFIVGSRRVVKNANPNSQSFYKTNIHGMAVESLKNVVPQNMIFYGEIVGWENESSSIMPTVDNSKLGKDFIKQFGSTTTFSYGCKQGEYKLYVYRITFIDEREQYDLHYDQVMQMCEKLGIMYSVPIYSGKVKDIGEPIDQFIGKMQNKASLIDPSHIEEGFIVHKESFPKSEFFKDKGFYFKVLDGIIKDTGVLDKETQESDQDLVEQ